MQPAAPLDRALASASSGIVVADATVEGFPLTYVNAAFERMTGYAAADCLGRNCSFLQGDGTDPASVAELSAALRTGRESHTVLLNYRADGTAFHNELRLAPVYDEHDRMIQVVGVQHDVTDHYEARELLERERDRAVSELRALQAALTPPTLPARPRLELASCFLPAEAGVAGDFHLVLPGPGDTTVLVVGDAMGHGLEAAQRATFVRTALATFSRFTDDPLRLLEMANHSLIERVGTSAAFVTAICASYDPVTRRLVWSTAGHPAPLSLETGRPLGAPERAGVPLGIDIDLGGTRAEVELKAGAGFLLFTDGLTEARRSAGERLGDERVASLVRELGGGTPQRIVDRLGEEALAHAGGVLADDLCVVAARPAG
jgi:PAS domain S-box-containing protein